MSTWLQLFVIARKKKKKERWAEDSGDGDTALRVLRLQGLPGWILIEHTYEKLTS